MFETKRVMYVIKIGHCRYIKPCHIVSYWFNTLELKTTALGLEVWTSQADHELVADTLS